MMMKKIILAFMLISCAQSSNGTYNPIISVSPNPDINGQYVYNDPFNYKVYIFGQYNTYKEYIASANKIIEYQ